MELGKQPVEGWVVLENKVCLREQVCGGRSWAGSRHLGGQVGVRTPMASLAPGVCVREKPGVRAGRWGVSEGRSRGREGGWGADSWRRDAETHAAQATRWTDVSVEEGGHLIARCGAKDTWMTVVRWPPRSPSF